MQLVNCDEHYSGAMELSRIAQHVGINIIHKMNILDGLDRAKKFITPYQRLQTGSGDVRSGLVNDRFGQHISYISALLV